MTCSICQKVALQGISLGNGNIIHNYCLQNLTDKINDYTHQIKQKNYNLTALKLKIFNRNSITGKLTAFLLGDKNLNNEEANIQSAQDNIIHLQKNLNAMEAISKSIFDLMLDYPPDWKNRVDKVKSRDYSCVKCSSTHDLHAHHIKRLSDSGSNKIENLQLLCEKCHSKEHDGRDFSKSKSSTPAISDRIIKINNAIISNNKIEFLYRKFNDEKFQKRVVTPTKITGYDHKNKEDSTLCVEGFCHIRNENRVFALKRMKDVKISMGN